MYVFNVVVVIPSLIHSFVRLLTIYKINKKDIAFILLSRTMSWRHWSPCYVYRCTDNVVIETTYCGSVEKEKTFAPPPQFFFF